MAIALIGTVWMTRIPRPRAPTAPLEVLRADLVLRDGRLYRLGQTSPFNGWMLERYADHSLRSRSMVSDGRLHGVSEGWHTNGVLAVRERFEAGTAQGLRTKWYASGAKKSEATIVNGQLDGTFRRWHENGRLEAQIELSHGKAQGDSYAYYPSGSLKTHARLDAGEVVRRQSWKDGSGSDLEPPMNANGRE